MSNYPEKSAAVVEVADSIVDRMRTSLRAINQLHNRLDDLGRILARAGIGNWQASPTAPPKDTEELSLKEVSVQLPNLIEGASRRVEALISVVDGELT